MKTGRLYKLLTSLLFLLLAGSGSVLYAQVKIGNNPRQLDANAVLEMEAVNKGMLLPRVELESTMNAAPMTGFSRGLVVYNTATQNDVSPGIYYCDGAKWMKIAAGGFSAAPPVSWNLAGNAGTVASSSFIGTTDNMGLRFRTNNIERLSIAANGYVGIGTTAPAATLHVNGQVIIDTLTAGDVHNDRVLVAGTADGKVKAVAAGSFLTGTQKKLEVVATNGQTVFLTPAPFTDSNRIMLYRNGVLIAFTVNNSNSVIAEVPCMAGDEIRIIQLL